MSELPNLRWREWARRGFYGIAATGPDPEGDFLRHVEHAHAEEKRRLGLLPADAPELQKPNLALLLIGVARLTYGQLDAIDELLRNAPPIRASARTLLQSVDALIPLPSGLEARANPEAALGWINENRGRLLWVPEEGRFRLRET